MLLPPNIWKVLHILATLYFKVQLSQLTKINYDVSLNS